jgi:Fe-S-cluster containining protein
MRHVSIPNVQHPELLRSVMQATYGYTHTLLGESRQDTDVLTLAERCYAQTEQLIEYARTKILTETTTACQAGCSTCCHLRMLNATAPEIFAILQHCQSSRFPIPLNDLRESLEIAYKATAHRAHHEWRTLGIYCPFLHAHRCAIYPVRPLFCRGFTAYNVQACEQALQHTNGSFTVPGFIPQYEIAKGAYIGVRFALQDLHLAGNRPLVFPWAMRIALTTPNALERWLQGEPIFAEAEWHEDVH